jgi:lysozyme family protein
MESNFTEALKHVLKHEGGYVNHPSDPGGMTNLGVTRKVWESWTGKQATEADMRALTPEVVAPLYKKMYWDKVQGDELPVGVDYAVFDFAVNAGVSRASRALQNILFVASDGIIGPNTLRVAAQRDPKELIELYSEDRRLFYSQLPTFSVFGKGWLRRVDDVKTHALKMLDSA